MGNIYAGTSGWAYPTWRRKFYPADLSSAKFLEYYAGRLNTVEVNYTFRTLPTRLLLKNWSAATPAGFTFAIKAHQTITHIKRLRDAKQATSEFLASLRSMLRDGKLGPVLFQLPPFSKCDVSLLADFVESLPGSTRATFEFRHPSWFCDEVYAILRKTNVALCLAESDDLVTPNLQTADFSYLRLRKSKYPPKARAEILQRVKKLKRSGDVFIYFKHEDSPDGALHAEQFLAAVRHE
jgi:uncharacterized protein YecE (DUF72 family)